MSYASIRNEKKEHEISHEGIICNYIISAHQLGISHVLCLQHSRKARLSPGRGEVTATLSEQYLQFCETLDQHGSKQRQHCEPSALPHTAVGWLQSGGRKGGESTKMR